jgi:diguanylate cyclase (GGDEF)-like protein
MKHELHIALKESERIQRLNTTLQLEKKDILEKAHRDALTGAYNRLGIRDKLIYAMESRVKLGVQFCLILIDIDDFKQLNDTKGHLEGDKALINLVNLLMRNLRETDYLCRWGGEEFFVLIMNANIDAARGLAEKLRKNVEESSLGFTCSFGVAQAFKNEFEEILDAADRALYKAKNDGKNRVGLAFRKDMEKLP